MDKFNLSQQIDELEIEIYQLDGRLKIYESTIRVW
jgi:hypothetical protein